MQHFNEKDCTMIDGFLLEFQLGEILDAIKMSFFCVLLVFGLALWGHATYIRKDAE